MAQQGRLLPLTSTLPGAGLALVHPDMHYKAIIYTPNPLLHIPCILGAG